MAVAEEVLAVHEGYNSPSNFAAVAKESWQLVVKASRGCRTLRISRWSLRGRPQEVAAVVMEVSFNLAH